MPRQNIIRKSALTPTVLIAGGAGFIGSHLVEALLLHDARVIVLDNFKTGRDFYIGHLLNHPKFALYDVDINSGFPPEIESVDYVIHLAGLEEYLYSEDQVNLDALLTNAVGTKNLLDLASRSHAKFLLASSIYVYQGMMSQINLDQYFGRTNIEEKKYSATEAKRYAEALVWEYYKKNDTNVRIVRLPEIYGPKMDLDASGNLGRLIKELMDNKNLVIYGDGIEKEHYLYVTDAVNAIVRALFNDKTTGKIYSLTPPEPYSVIEIAFLLKTLANREIKVEFKNKMREMEPRQAYPDTSNLRDLKWDTKKSFKEGIVKTLMWYGYDVNQHSFKPAKYIEEKRKEKALTDSLTSLGGPIPVENVSTPQKKEEETINSVINFAQVPMEKVERVSVLQKFKQKFKKPVQKKPVTFDITPNEKPSETAPFPKSKLRKWMLPSLLALCLTALTLFLILPALSVYYHVNNAVRDMKEVPILLGQFKTTSAQKKAESAFQSFNKGHQSFNRMGWLFTISGKSDTYSSLSKTLSSASYTSKSAYYFSKASLPLSSLWDTVKPTSEESFDREEFENYKGDFAVSRNNMQMALAEYKHVDLDTLPSSIRDNVQEYGTALESVSEGMEIYSSAVAGLSDLLGLEGSKKYLILFQNNNELRPTGGFIGSYALLEMDAGKIKSLKIDDIYNPDGQIDVRNIETSQPPAPIKEYLNEDKLYIRNANWNPSFPLSAREIQTIYQRVEGIKTDGVIAVDLYFAKNMLEVTGPVFLTAYNEEISAANLYERTQFHSDFNYEDGSDQKRQFLTVLGSKLLESIFALPSDNLPEFWAEMYRSLNEKHLMIYLSNNPFGATLEGLGWDGSLIPAEEDYLYIVNSNLGGNKADYFMTTSYDYNIKSETRDGILRGELTMTYEHKGTDTSWPGGVYKNYVRVLTQAGSKLTGAKVDYGGDTTDIFTDVVLAREGNYNSFEFGVEVEPQSILRVTLSYDLPSELALSNGKSDYNLYWQKQPGTQESHFLWKFNPPLGLSADVTESNGTLDADKEIYVILKPQK